MEESLDSQDNRAVVPIAPTASVVLGHDIGLVPSNIISNVINNDDDDGDDDDDDEEQQLRPNANSILLLLNEYNANRFSSTLEALDTIDDRNPLSSSFDEAYSPASF